MENTEKLEIIKSDDVAKIQTGIQSFNERKLELETLAESAKQLVSIENKEDYKIVSAKRKELKAARVKVSNESKAMKAIIKNVTDLISTSEKDLTAITTPEETRLEGLEECYEAEQEKIKIEKENVEKQRIQDRINELAKFNHAVDYIVLVGLTDEQYNQRLLEAETEFKQQEHLKFIEEQQRLEKQLIEQERIEKERAELEELRKLKQQLENEKLELQKQVEAAAQKAKEEQEAALQKAKDEEAAALRAKQEEENRKIQEEKLAQQKILDQQREEKLKKEAAEKAIKDAAEKEEKKKIAEQKRLEKLPDLEKMKRLVLSASFNNELLSFKTEEIQKLSTKFVQDLEDLKSNYLITIENLNQ
jgi:hypothetical protein